MQTNTEANKNIKTLDKIKKLFSKDRWVYTIITFLVIYSFIVIDTLLYEIIMLYAYYVCELLLEILMVLTRAVLNLLWMQRPTRK